MPWARPGSGFMLLFGAMVVEPAKSQPVADIAEPVGGHDTRPWRFIRHYVQEARLWIGNGVLDGFLEDESLFGEFLRTPVSEGGVEPLVVEPPHVVVGGHASAARSWCSGSGTRAPSSAACSSIRPRRCRRGCPCVTTIF